MVAVLRVIPRLALAAAAGALILAALMTLLLLEESLTEALGPPLRVGIVGVGAAGALAWFGRAIWRRAASVLSLE
jgi:hypothetical protein